MSRENRGFRAASDERRAVRGDLKWTRIHPMPRTSDLRGVDETRTAPDPRKVWERRMVRALGILLVVGWGIAIAHGLFARTPNSGGSRAGTTASAQKSDLSENISPSLKAPALMTVYVTGAVRKPGLYRLPLDARVAQVVAAAGGSLRTADLAGIDLAAVVEDGSQVVVPAQGTLSGNAYASNTGAANAGVSAPGRRRYSRGRGKLMPGQRIDVNTAGKSELIRLPGVGMKRAQEILAYRKSHGLFASLTGLSHIRGIGPKLLARILPYVTL